MKQTVRIRAFSHPYFKATFPVTCIVAAILFSGHPYIGRHYCASLIEYKILTFSSSPEVLLRIPESSEQVFLVTGQSHDICQ